MRALVWQKLKCPHGLQSWKKTRLFPSGSEQAPDRSEKRVSYQCGNTPSLLRSAGVRSAAFFLGRAVSKRPRKAQRFISVCDKIVPVTPMMHSCPCNSGLNNRRMATALQLLVLVFLLAGIAHGQPSKKYAQDELEIRLKAAQAVRLTGTPADVARANALVIAEGLREDAAIELATGDPKRAAELYRESIQFEDSISAYAELAYAEARAAEYDKAIEAAEVALKAEPRNVRLMRVLASSWTQKGEPVKAEPYFIAIVKAQPDVDNYYPLAVCQLAIKTPEARQRALASFDEMKKLAGDSGSLHVLIGRAFRDGGDMPGAIAEFHKALALNPRTPHAHYFIGLAELSLNEWVATPEAEAEMRKEAELFPNDYLANFMLGFILSEGRQYSEAAKFLDKAAKIDPSSPDPYLYEGMNDFLSDDWANAEPLLRKAVELTGNEESRANYQIRRAYVDLARIDGKKGNAEEARYFAQRGRELQNKTLEESQQRISAMMLNGGTGSAAAVVPLSREQESTSLPATSKEELLKKLSPTERHDLEAREQALHSVLALAYNDMATAFAMAQDYAKAEALYAKAEFWDSSLDGLEKNLGLSAFRARDYPTAAKALSIALKTSSGADALRAMLGLSYFAMDQYSFAVDDFTPLGMKGMKDGEVGYAWAASLTHLSDMKQATEVLTAYLSEPRPNDALLLAGLLWVEIGEYGKAIDTFDLAIMQDALLPRAHFDEGLAYIHWGKWTDAEKAFQAELALRPGDPDAKYHLGFVYLQESKTDAALALFQDVIDAHPKYANAQYQIGKIYLDRDDLQNAVQHLQIAADLTPDKPYIHYQLQAAYRKMGRSDEADRELDIYKSMKAKSREQVSEQLQQIQHQ